MSVLAKAYARLDLQKFIREKEVELEAAIYPGERKHLEEVIARAVKNLGHLCGGSNEQ
jgi:hypothetical protein